MTITHLLPAGTDVEDLVVALLDQSSTGTLPDEPEIAVDKIVEYVRRLVPTPPAGIDIEYLVCSHARQYATARVRAFLGILITKAVLDELRGRQLRDVTKEG